MSEATDIIARVDQLQNFWAPRSMKLQAWYQMIQLQNNLHQDKMESVISSDPRTGFNMARFLLQPKTTKFVMDTDGFTQPQIDSAGRVEAYADRQLLKTIRRQRTNAKGTLLKRLTGLMLATGWYAMISFPTDKGWWWEVWNPASIFPEYSADGDLVAVGRKYNVTGQEANAKTMLSGWSRPSIPYNNRTTYAVRNIWELHPAGVVHGVTIGHNIAKPRTLTGFQNIPIITGPCAGLPDDGSIMQDDQWKAEIGASLVAPIMDVQHNYNKMLTYLQQLLRDTANPRWVERVQQGGVVTPDNLYERGAVYTIEPGEDIWAVQPPGLPAEFRGHQFDLRSQTQRGLFSDITFGNITSQVSGFLMNQVTAAAKQNLDPFHSAQQDALGETATRNVSQMQLYGMNMGGSPVPSLPEETHLDFKYDIEIPGDFIQRASAARVLNPNFKLSPDTLYDVLFPEVANATREMGKVRTADALESPHFKQVFIIHELSTAARQAQDAGDDELTDILQNALEAATGELESFASGPEGAPNTTLPEEVREVQQGR